MYKIYDDGQEYGPIEYGPIEEQKLRSWIRERRVLGTTLAFKEGLEDWVPLSDFIEFATDFATLDATDFATLEMAAASTKSQLVKAAAAKTAPRASVLHWTEAALLKAAAAKTPGKTAKAETAPVVTGGGKPK